MSEQVRQAWDRIEQWFSKNVPSALENMGEPATQAQLDACEQALGVTLPDDVRASYMIHNGIKDENNPGLFSSWDVFLSLDQVIENWKICVDIAKQFGGNDDTPDAWRTQAEEKIIFIKGSVKPLPGSSCWIPITNMNGDVLRYLDFDPAPGGTPGQVIEVDAEGCMYQVLANSFTAG